MVAHRADSRRWMDEGTQRVARALAGLDEEAFAGPSALPGWTRKHVASHLAANADALSNLVSWASTGVESRMYSSPAIRAVKIDAGATRSGDDLRAWFEAASAALAAGMDALTTDQWRARVVSLQGRQATAAQTPWVRSRELFVHLVDLNTGTTFADLPRDFLAALCDDIVLRRLATPRHPALRINAVDVDSGRWTIAAGPGPGPRRAAPGPIPTVSGPLAELTAYLAGRAYQDLSTADGEPLPTLPAWL